MAKKTEHEKKVQKRLDQWKERLKELEDSVEKIGGKAQVGLQRALRELKEQRSKIQVILDRLKKGGGKAYEEGRKGLDTAIVRFEKGYKDVSKTSLWKKTEKGFDEAWGVSKKAALRVSDKMGKATHRTKLHLENHRLKGQISKIFAQIGDDVYKKIVKEGKKTFVPTIKNRSLLEEVLELEKALVTNMKLLKKEKKR